MTEIPETAGRYETRFGLQYQRESSRFVLPSQVVEELGHTPEAIDEPRLLRAVDAVNAYLMRVRPDIGDPWPADFHGAAVVLAARWYSRFAGGDAAQYTEFGPLPIQDNDLAAFLGLGRHHGPVVA